MPSGLNIAELLHEDVDSDDDGAEEGVDMAEEAKDSVLVGGTPLGLTSESFLYTTFF